MSHDNQGTTRVVGSNFQPVIVHVAGADRSALEGCPELQGNCIYLALFNEGDPSRISSYVGMTSCGQDRPRVGAHLAQPELASSIFVIADTGNGLTELDAAVLERFLYAKVEQITHWKLRCGRPRASGVGMTRFSELMNFGGEVLCLLQGEHKLFSDVAPGRLRSAPRQFEPILYDFFQGPAEGSKMILDAFGITAYGIDMGERGFVISAGSQVRAGVVASASGLNAARREELLYGGHLRRLANGNLEVRRDLWRPSATSAAKLVTGSSASAGHWCPIKGPRLRLV